MASRERIQENQDAMTGSPSLKERIKLLQQRGVNSGECVRDQNSFVSQHSRQTPYRLKNGHEVVSDEASDAGPGETDAVCSGQKEQRLKQPEISRSICIKTQMTKQEVPELTGIMERTDVHADISQPRKRSSSASDDKRLFVSLSAMENIRLKSITSCGLCSSDRPLHRRGRSALQRSKHGSQPNLTMCGIRQRPGTFCIPQPVFIHNMNAYKMAFLRSCSPEDLLLELGVKYARLQVLSKAIRIRCTLTYATPDAHKLANTWASDVKDILKIALSSINFEKIGIRDDLWTAVKLNVDSLGYRPDEMLLLTEEEERAFVVVGKSDAVESFSKKVKTIVRAAEMDTERDKQLTHVCTLERYQLDYLYATGFKDEMEELHEGLTIDTSDALVKIFFRGKLENIESAVAAMNDRLSSVHSLEVDMPAAKLTLLGKQETNKTVAVRFKVESLQAVYQLSKSEDRKLSLKVFASSVQAAERAITVVQDCIRQEECPVPDGNPDFTQSTDVRRLLETLKDDYKGKVEFDVPRRGRKVIVTATCDVISLVTERIMGKFRYKSYRSETVLISGGHLKFLRDVAVDEVHTVEDELTEHSVQVSLEQEGLRIYGSRKGIDLAKMKLKDVLGKIFYYEYELTDQLAIKFLSTEHGKLELQQLEKSRQCVVSFQQDTTKSETLQHKQSDLPVTIMLGNIAEQKVDVIVNCLAADLKLNKGAVSSSTLRSAGTGLQEEFQSKSANGVRTGSAVYTSGHNLPCKQVCHMVLTSWDTPGAEETLYKVIIACLTDADQRGYTSVAFPLIGTSHLGYPLDAIGLAIMDAASSFHSDVPNSTLMDIRIVVYTKDVEEFQILTLLQQHRQESISISEHAKAASERATSLHIYTSSREAAMDVVNTFENMVERHIETQKINEEMTANMTPEQRKILEQICCWHDVRLSTDPNGRGLVLKGLDSKVYKASAAIFQLVFAAVQLQCDSMIQRMVEFVQWYYLKLQGPNNEEASRPHTPDNNMRIEQAFLAKEPSAEVTMDGQTVVIDFKLMMQYPKNNLSDTHFVIRRNIAEAVEEHIYPGTQAYAAALAWRELQHRPGYQGYQDGIHPLHVTIKCVRTIAKGYTCSICCPAFEVKMGRARYMARFRLPEKWTSTPTLRVVVPELSHEYGEVEKTFQYSLGDKPVVIWSIERIQNERLWRQYTAHRDHLDKQNSGHVNEMTLWHGTHGGAVDRILRYGFNRSYCGRNATVFGEGVYFAVNAWYSADDKYSHPDASGKKFVFLCKVLAGHSTAGKSQMRVLPDRCDGIPYDSATDNPRSPSMYIVFSDNQAYPEYLVTFQSIT